MITPYDSPEGMAMTEKMSAAVVLPGKANDGTLRQAFADKIAGLHDEDFFECAEKKIWLSAYANNNPRSDYHWQADACYDEAQRRGKPELYSKAWKKAASA